jgi:hypothetical protein
MKGNWCHKTDILCQEGNCQNCAIYYEHLKDYDNYGRTKSKKEERTK